MNYVEQFYSTNIKLRAFEDALAETMVLIKIFVTVIFAHLRNCLVNQSQTSYGAALITGNQSLYRQSRSHGQDGHHGFK